MQKETVRRVISWGVMVAMVVLVAGCYVTSPYDGQKISTNSSQVPIQVYTSYQGYPVKIECATSHYGYVNEDDFVPLTTITPAAQGLLDTRGNVIYQASKKVVIPASCWRYWGYIDDSDPTKNISHATAIRITQEQPKVFGSGTQDVTFKGFKLDGLECLGKHTGAQGYWFGALTKGCEHTYSNSNTSVPYVRLMSTNP